MTDGRCGTGMKPNLQCSCSQFVLSRLKGSDTLVTKGPQQMVQCPGAKMCSLFIPDCPQLYMSQLRERLALLQGPGQTFSRQNPLLMSKCPAGCSKGAAAKHSPRAPGKVAARLSGLQDNLPEQQGGSQR